jgi:hypothetical protein
MFTSLQDSLAAVKEFLSSHPLEDFHRLHGIKAKQDVHGHIILDYDMLEVKWTEPYGYICRGLVLSADTFDVLGFGLQKFFNFGEFYAADIDWDTSRIYEKVDGSMVQRWFSPHTGRFEYSTRRQLPPDIAANTLQDTDITWQALIGHCLKDVLADIDQAEDETMTFEVMSPANRIVVKHSDYHGRLLCVRNNKTLVETNLFAHALAPKTYEFASQDACVDFANTLSGLESEGFVVVDENFNRVKVKGRDYLALHHLKDSAGSSLKSLIMVVRRGEWSEVANAFPEFIPAMKAIEELVKDWEAVHVEAYEELKDIPIQKDFALAVQAKKLPQSALLFDVRGEKAASISDAIEKLDDSRYVRCIKPLAEKARIALMSIEGS